MCLEFLVTLGLGHKTFLRAEKLKQKKTSAGQPLPCWGPEGGDMYIGCWDHCPQVRQIVAQTDLWLSQRTVPKEDQRFSDASWASWCKDSMINTNHRHICSRLFIARPGWIRCRSWSEFWDLRTSVCSSGGWGFLLFHWNDMLWCFLVTPVAAFPHCSFFYLTLWFLETKNNQQEVAKTGWGFSEAPNLCYGLSICLWNSPSHTL